MNRIQKYFFVVGLYLLFLLCSFKYSPLSDALRDENSDHYYYGLSGRFYAFHGSVIEPVQGSFSDESYVLNKILVYGIEQYVYVWDYPFLPFLLNSRYDYALQFFVSSVLTGWIFIVFQVLIMHLADIICYEGSNKFFGFWVNISYAFYIENIIGYISQISIYWTQKIIRSKQLSHVLKIIYNAGRFVYEHVINPIFMKLVFPNGLDDRSYGFSQLVAGVVLLLIIYYIIKIYRHFIIDTDEFFMRIQFFIFGPWLVVGLLMIIFLLFMFIIVSLIEYLSSLAFFQSIIFVNHFKIIFFVTVFLIWKKYVESPLSVVLYSIISSLAGVSL